MKLSNKIFVGYNMSSIYNSRNPRYKSVFGALQTNQETILKILLPRNISCSRVELVIYKDGSNNKYYDFYWNGMPNDDQEWWSLTYHCEEKGIFFYHFLVHTPWGTMQLQHSGDFEGKFIGANLDWQLTIYDENFTTPNWLKGGMIYQIFPDRFYFSGETKANISSDRVLRDDWYGVPSWEFNSKGKMPNNDFFQGDLKGIEQKLKYIKSLGTTCIYLNPIFEAQSNHRYDTANYSNIDPVLGTEKDLKSLCAAADKLGISVMLDGVFSHTGDDSVYFNKYGRYDNLGAYQSKESKYYNWFKFENWPNKYHSWWDIDILPEVIEESKEFIEFISGEKGIARKWLKTGVRAWRLDVVDELPDVFLDELRKAVKAENSDALILGEVWEDASNKFSYGERRRYLQGDQLDSVMNYPFADAIMYYIQTGIVEGFSNKIFVILENYPKCVVDVLMNHIGTHDTMRAITQLVGKSCDYKDRKWQSEQTLTWQEFSKGVRLLKLAAIMQYTLPGVPSLYYGDEAGMQGYKDPFNRACYPWGKENEGLIQWYKRLGQVRSNVACFTDGSFCTVSEMMGCIAYIRENDSDKVMVIINRNEHEIDYVLPRNWENAEPIFGGIISENHVTINALEGVILKYRS